MKRINFRAWFGRLLLVLMLLFPILSCSFPIQTLSKKQAGPTPLKVKEVFSQPVSPSSTDQTVSYSDKLNVILPAGLVSDDTNLVISTPTKKLPAPSKLRSVLGVYDVSLGDRHEFNQNITLEFSYDPKKLDSKKPAAEQLTAGYWDNDQQIWVTLPSTVDEARHVLSITTDHLSAYGFFSWIGGYSATYSDHFVAIYNEKAINKGQAAYYKSVSPYPRYKVNPFISDILDFLEVAYKVYSDAGYKLPAGKIDVEVADFADSELRSLIGNIRISTLSSSDPIYLRQDCAHELFHAVQRETLGIMNYISRHWWMEATADYAADAIAWASIGGTGEMGSDITPKYLETTLTSLDGQINYAYSTSHFIEWMVETKKVMTFKELWDLTAAGGNDVLQTLINKINTPEPFGYLYTEFAQFFIFDPSSPDTKTTSISKDIAFLSSPFPESKKELRESFSVGYFTAKLWAIEAQFERNVVIKRMDSNYGMVSYAVLAGDDRASTLVAAPDSIVTGGTASVHLQEGDTLYILMDNTISKEPQTFDIRVNESEYPTGMFTLRLKFDDKCDSGYSNKNYNSYSRVYGMPVKIDGTDVSIQYDKTTGVKHFVADGQGKINDKGVMTLNYTYSYKVDKSCYSGDCQGSESGFGTFTGTWNGYFWEGKGSGSVDVDYPNTMDPNSKSNAFSCSANVIRTQIEQGFVDTDL